MSDQLSPEAAEHRRPEHEVDTQFLNRWSPRAYLPKEVPADVLGSLLEAARWAPSSGNGQPWRYVVARTLEDRERVLSFVNPSNAEWCAQAPVLVVVFAHQVQANGNPNRWGGFDAGTSWGYLALAASQLGLSAHAMGGFDKDKALEALGVPGDGSFEAMAVIALGYRGPKEQLTERNREREKPSTRRAFEESFFEGRFGTGLKV